MTDLQDLSIEEAKALIQKQASRKPSKYRNKKTAYNGRVYDSAREARHAMELDVRLKAGEFEEWTPQVPLELAIAGTVICTYIADFVLRYRDGRRVIEETKGKDTAVWKLKHRLLLATYLKEHPNYQLRVIR